MDPTIPQNTAAAVPEPYWNLGRKIFLLWAVVILVGFTLTYFTRTINPTLVNLGWAGVSLAALVYMKRLMPFSDPGLRNLFLLWSVLIALGIALTEGAFTVPILVFIAPNIGVFWLVLMALGHALSGALVRKKIYIATTAFQLAAALGAYLLIAGAPEYFAVQYLIVGVAGSLSMVILIFRA